MDGIGEYHAKWNKPIPKTKGWMLSLRSEEWYIMVWTGGEVRRMEELRLCRGKWEGGGGYEKWWNETDIITLCTCMITWMIWIYIVHNHRNKMMHPVYVQRIKMQSVKINNFFKRAMEKVLIRVLRGKCCVPLTSYKTKLVFKWKGNWETWGNSFINLKKEGS